MAIRQCTRHHFYDDEKYKVCPICLSLSSQNHENEDRTVAYTTPLDDAADKTIGYQALKDDAVAKPTVGWVVCVKGKNCGRDWRLHEGRNDIGTAVNAEVPIQLTGQECGCACSVIYDGKHKETGMENWKKAGIGINIVIALFMAGMEVLVIRGYKKRKNVE